MPHPQPSLSSLVRSVLLTEAADPDSLYSRSSFARAVRESDLAYGSKEREKNMRAVAEMIADPSADFASIESLASLIVAGEMYKPKGGSSPDVWSKNAAFYWKRALPGNDSDHLRKAIVNEIERRSGDEAEGQDDREETPAGEAQELRSLTPSEMASALEDHRLWITRGGGAYQNTTKRGERPNLERVDFKGAKLMRANLSRAILSHSDFTGADLRLANLIGADLVGANLSGANLTGAKLLMAHLDGANLDGATYNSRTSFSRGFDPTSRGMTLVDG